VESSHFRAWNVAVRKPVVALVAVLALAIVVPILRVRHYESAFEGVSVGSNREAVLARMGQPRKHGECGAYLGGKAPGCIEEFIYVHPYAPYVPEYWSVQFDASRKVVSREHLVSP
jgi:hypothetical protein